MNNYFIDQITQKPVKIGSKSYIKLLKDKIHEIHENKEIMNNISYESYLKIKDNLPKLNDNQFYCHVNDCVLIKNKSIKIDDFSKYISDQLPEIIDKIIEQMHADSDITNIKSRITNIFHNALIH